MVNPPGLRRLGFCKPCFRIQELLLTLVNSVIAWKVTTQQTFPEVLVKLQEHRQWISSLAEEPRDFHSVGHDSTGSKAQVERHRFRTSSTRSGQWCFREKIFCGGGVCSLHLLQRYLAWQMSVEFYAWWNCCDRCSKSCWRLLQPCEDLDSLNALCFLSLPCW